MTGTGNRSTVMW